MRASRSVHHRPGEYPAVPQLGESPRVARVVAREADRQDPAVALQLPQVLVHRDVSRRADPYEVGVRTRATLGEGPDMVQVQLHRLGSVQHNTAAQRTLIVRHNSEVTALAELSTGC